MASENLRTDRHSVASELAPFSLASDSKMKLPAITTALASLVSSDSVDTVARAIIGRRGIRSLKVARVRAAMIPSNIRRTGLSRQYLTPLDNGHISAVARNPAAEFRASNQTWEMARMNRATGAGRKPSGYWQANSRAIRQHGWRTLSAGCLRCVGRGALIGAAIETPFAIWSQHKLVRDGKPIGDAAKHAGKRIGIAAAAGGAASGVIFGLTAVGLSPILTPVAVGVLGFEVAKTIHAGRQSRRLDAAHLRLVTASASARMIRRKRSRGTRTVTITPKAIWLRSRLHRA